jgi:putative acetyltransferase
MQIKIDNLASSEIQQLLKEHLGDMRRISPPESVHALDLTGLLKPEITFWSAWKDDELLGCGALKELNPEHGEIKSMRTALSHRHEGVASSLLRHMLDEAKGDITNELAWRLDPWISLLPLAISTPSLTLRNAVRLETMFRI